MQQSWAGSSIGTEISAVDCFQLSKACNSGHVRDVKHIPRSQLQVLAGLLSQEPALPGFLLHRRTTKAESLEARLGIIFC